MNRLYTLLIGACLIPAALSFAQDPAPESAPLNEVAKRAYDKTHDTFCENEKSLACLGITKDVCLKNVDSYLKVCLANPDQKLLDSGKEDLILGYFFGCASGAAIKATAKNSVTWYQCMTKQ